MRVRVLTGALFIAAARAGCQRGADTGASSNPNAPGSPGSGNAVSRSPQQGESSSGRGTSGVAGSAAHPGASGGDAVPGASGKGTADASGQGSSQPGTGLQGGLGASNGTSAMGAGPAGQDAAAQGSTNRTSNGSFGNRR